mgnify:FL=1|tara:strand:- start:28 stop:735 length:708 start_codon:yes stop_codon:yes gene_type:complete
MIQGFTETNIEAYLQTEDNRINTSVTSSNIRHLFKFTNDMNGDVFYAYAKTETIYDRYTYFLFDYAASPDMFAGQVKFSPAGYWKYEVYEVSWIGTPSLVAGRAPQTELSVLTPAANTRGIVQGLVTKGKMYIDEKAGTEEVKYIQSAKSVQTLTIKYGGAGYTSAPTLTIVGDNITQATATATVAGGVVNAVTITNAGNGYTENPTVTVSGGGATLDASITASIEETNYIYYGQ